MLSWIYIVLIANTVLTLLYVIVKAVHKEQFGIALFFFFLPVAGFFIYFSGYFIQGLLHAAGVDKDELLVTAFDIEALPEHPDVKEELDVVPVEDALAISENKEKRSLLLNQLKRDMTDSYRLLMAAEQDEDSESAHYVAAAKMEVYRIQQQHWLDVRKDYEENPHDVKNFHDACDALIAIFETGAFSQREVDVYRRLYCQIIADQLELDRYEITMTEFETYLMSLIELNRFDDAEAFWVSNGDIAKSENTYHLMLKMFYQMGEEAKFESCLQDLRQNRTIQLSSIGLDQLRYWSARLNAVQNCKGKIATA